MSSCSQAEFGTGQVFWSMLWFFLFFIWIWLLIVVFSDIFRSHDLSGWGKALWSIFVIVVPYLGVFVYLIARGHKMQSTPMRRRAGAGRRDPSTTSRASPARAVAARPTRWPGWPTCGTKGVISEDEFQQAKARTLG